jgi:methylmalonyl-CoA/ethylmalonyl-CoA epimerase
MSPTRVHHINFIVNDLDVAAARFEKTLNLEPFDVVDHPIRGVRAARAKIGESWLVLVCPYDAESVPGRYLAAHGEGFFLLSLGVEGLAQTIARLEDDGIECIDSSARTGILDWQVADIGLVHGALMQLTEDGSNDSN